MTKKRKSQVVQDSDTPSSKRHQANFEGDDGAQSLSLQQNSNGEQPRVDPQYGQRGAFPGLDDGEDDEPFYGPPNDGMDYLRMVRSEARGVPSILIAPKSLPEDEDEDIYNNPYHDSRGYYDDGAYVAAPILGPYQPHTSEALAYALAQGGRADAASEGIDPQDAYYEKLLERFRVHRQHLHTEPSASSITALGSTHPISFPSRAPHYKSASHEWRRLLGDTDPLPAQLASMDTETILNLLKMVRGRLRRGEQVESRLSAWIWGILGRLQDVGELGSEEVAVVRELAKRAVWVAEGWRESMARMATDEESGRRGDKEAKGRDTEGSEGERGHYSDDGHDLDDADGMDEEHGRDDEHAANEEHGVDGSRQIKEPTLSNPDGRGEETVLNNELHHALDLQEPQEEVPPEDAAPDPSGNTSMAPDSFHKHQGTLQHASVPIPPASTIDVPSQLLVDQQATPSSLSSTVEPDSTALETAKARLLDKYATADPLLEACGPHARNGLGPGQDEKEHEVGEEADEATGAQEDIGEKEEEGQALKGPSRNTLATLDMIITIAGEMYGQRDLLEFREIWGEFEE